MLSPLNSRGSGRLQQWTGVTLFLFVTATLISQSLMDLFSFVFVVLVLIGLKQGQYSVQRPLMGQLLKAIGAFFIIVCVGLILGSSTVETPSFKKLLDFKWWIIAGLIGVFLSQFRFNQRHLQQIFWVLFFSSGFAILIFSLGYNPLEPGSVMDRFPDGTVRTGGFHGQPIVFAQLYGIWTAFLGGMLVCKLSVLRESHQSHRGPWVYWLAFAAGVLAILLSFTRGVWIALPLALFFALFLKRKSWAAAGLAVAGIAGFVLSLFWPAFEARVLQALQGGDSERIWIWKANWEMFLDHPWLGVGYSHNVQLLPQYYLKLGAPEGLLESHAHNQFLHILAGTGILGLISYLFIWIVLFQMAFGAWRIFRDHTFKGPLVLGVLSALMEFQLGGLFESNFEHSKIRSTLAVVIGVLLWLSHPGNNSSLNAPEQESV